MKFVLSRLAQMVLVVFAVTLLAFGALNFLGDPLFNVVGPIAGVDQAELSEVDRATIVEALSLMHI